MPTFSVSQRLKIALGGFVCFIGATVLVCAILTFTGSVDAALVLQGPVSLFIALIVAFLDITSGLLLIFTDKKISFSFRSNKNKADNNTNQPS